jgi:hypothetical protein
MIRKVVFLAVAVFALLVGTAQAHTASATAGCGSVTFNWQDFPSGGGNSGLNTPDWSVSFTPTGASSPSFTETNAPAASFSGSSFQLAVNNIPRVNGTVVASSSWTSSQTRSGLAGSYAQTFGVGDCPKLTPALSTTASPASASVGAATTDVAHLTGGYHPTGTISWALYGPSDSSCSSNAPLTTAPVAVNGDGDYTSPALTPSQAGSYHWVATYSGDANNNRVGPVGCSDANETLTLTAPPPQPPTTPPALPPVPSVGVRACIRTQTKIMEKTARNGKVLEVIVSGAKIKKVLFYLDGKWVKTLSAPNAGANYQIGLTPTRTRYGLHTVTAKVTLECGSAVQTVRFSHVPPTRKVVPPTVTPRFTA